MAHHKSNKAVEGNPGTGHGGGLPRRPDEDDLEARTEEDRAEAGVPPEPGASPAAQYADEEAEVDRQVERGEIASDARGARKDRDSFPPTRYDG
jgi:hypothetical protein